MQQSDVFILRTNKNHLMDSDIRNLKDLLSGAEVDKMEQYRFEDDRKRFIIGRGKLRQMIAKQTNLAAHDIHLKTNAQGKPALANQALEADWHFNISHSGDYIVIALTQAAAIGIDVEFAGRDMDFLPIAKRFFAASEYEYLNRCPREMQRDTFFHLWTCKESVVKAIGRGIAFGLDSFEVNPNPTLPAKLLNIDGSPEQHFFLHAWSIDTKHRAALTACTDHVNLVHVDAV